MMPGALTSTRRRSLGRDRPLAVERIAERIDHAAEQALAHRHVHDRAGALDGLALLDLAVVAEDHDADVVGFEVERHAAHAVLELDHLAGLNVVEAVDAGDAVADREHLADFGDFGLLAEVLDLLLEDRRDFRGANIHQPASFIASLIALSLVRSEVSTMRLPSLTTRPPMIAGSTFDVDLHVLPGDRRERVLDRGEVLLARRLGERHFGGHLALVTGDQRAERLDHVAHREQPAVRRHHLQEFGREPADADLVEDGGERVELLLGGEHRAADEAIEVGAVGHQRVEALEVALDGIDGILGERQLEQSGRVTARHPGDDSVLRLPRRILFRAIPQARHTSPTAVAKPLKFKWDLPSSWKTSTAPSSTKIARGLLTHGSPRCNTTKHPGKGHEGSHRNLAPANVAGATQAALVYALLCVPEPPKCLSAPCPKPSTPPPGSCWWASAWPGG